MINEQDYYECIKHCQCDCQKDNLKRVKAELELITNARDGLFGLVTDLKALLREAQDVLDDHTTESNGEEERNNNDVIEMRDKIIARLQR